MVPSAVAVLLLVHAHQAADAEGATRVGPLAAVPSNDVFLPWTCKGTLDPAASKLGRVPRLESDVTQEDGPWSLESLERGLPCSFATSRDGTRSIVLLKTGRASYYVLFFKRDVLVGAQTIHGPWALTIKEEKPATFPPSLEQVAEGDAGFLYKYAPKTGLYREEKYPYPPGYEMGE